MIQTEIELLRVLHGHGFDFSNTVREIAVRFPKELDYGVAGSEVVPFRLMSPLMGDFWKIPVNRGLEDDLPPTRYCHEFHPTRDPRQNHDGAVVLLRSLLGRGEGGPATNVYEESWTVGFFSIRVLTWPRELNQRSSNVFEGRNPNLWISANVSIEPEFPFIEPVEDASTPLRVLLRDGADYGLQCGSQVYARRNRVPARHDTREAGLEAGSFVIRTQDRTVRVPLGQIQSVKHTRVTPGRFGGSSSIEFETMFLNRHSVAVPVVNGGKTGSLDRIAGQLAAQIAKPLRVEEYSDDG